MKREKTPPEWEQLGKKYEGTIFFAQKDNNVSVSDE